MPRKAAAESGESGEPTSAAPPRRSTRIKEQPREVPAPKKTKPRAKKADKESTDKEEEKPKSRGRKRKEREEEPNGDAPTEKKVRSFF